MTHTLRNLLAIPISLILASTLSAQVELKLELQPDGQTYTTFARSQVDLLLPMDNLLHSADVTVVVPTGSLSVMQLQSHVGQWELSHLITQPMENPGADYAIFHLVGDAADGEFSEGEDVPLFSFENENGCAGAFELMDMQADPFASPNSLGIDIGNSFFAEGANGDAYLGNYAPSSADCMDFDACNFSFELELLPSGKYQVSLLASDSLANGTALQSLRVAVKVPKQFFQFHELENLQFGLLDFAGISRNDSPLESPDFDYLQIRLKSESADGLILAPAETLPLIAFGNGGSCTGDSIFLVKNDDEFRPPNSQGADIGQQVKLVGNPVGLNACVAGTGAAECLSCEFADEIISVDDVMTADPIACLGGANGMVQVFAEGAENLEFSLDGTTWTSSEYFDGLTAGTYLPSVRGQYFGCDVQTDADPVTLTDATTFTLQLNIPTTVCESNDLALQIMSPSPLPAGSTYNWSGPLGYSSAIADPAIFSVNPLQSGEYSLTVDAPGCQPATAASTVTVAPLPELPTLQTNAPICQGDTLTLSTDVQGTTFEWLGPAGQSATTLGLPGLTTASGQTGIPSDHPAYLEGDWGVRVTSDFGCQAESALLPVEVKERPQAFATNDGPVCLGKDVTLSGNPLPGAIYRWRKMGEPDVLSTQQNFMVTNVTAQQSYELEVEVDGCPSENISVTTVALHPKPAAYPIFDYQAAADCAPQDLQFTANATGIGLTFDWSGVNGFSSQVENPAIPQANAAANGSYQLQVTNVHGCTATSPFQVTGVVDAVPAPVVQSTGAVCPGDDILLTVQTDYDQSVSFTWFHDDDPIYGATSSQLNLDAVQAADVGMYQVEAEVGYCKVKSAPLLVDVLETPVASPSFLLAFPCEGSSLQFFSNTNDIVGWEWTGPNGFTSSSANPLIYNTEFDDIGAYSLTVTGSNGCTATDDIVVDGILQVPDVPEVATNSPVCPGENLVLTVQNPVTIGSVSYEWLNGIGLPIGYGLSTLAIDPNDPLAIPPYLVKANVNGCESELSEVIDVEVIPMPVAVAENTGNVCPGEEAQLFAAPIPDAGYEWRISGDVQVFSFEQNPHVTVNDTTTYELTVKTDGCQAQASDLTTVFTKEKPVTIALTGGGSFCEGSAVPLSGANSAPVAGDIQYTWTGPNGFHFTSTAPATSAFPVIIDVLQPQNEGTYTLTLVSAEGCVSQPQSVVVDYVEMPEPPELTVVDAQLCQAETLQLDASPYSGNSVQYDWYFQDGPTDLLLGSTTFPAFFVNNVMPSNSGTYFVNVDVDGCAPPSSNLEEVTVQGIGVAPEAISSTTAADPACEGEEVALEVPLIPGANYEWFGPGGFESSANNPLLPEVTMAQAGDYLVNVSFDNCSTVLTANTSVHVAPTPEAPELVGATLVCEGTDVTVTVANAAPGAEYEFYFSPTNSLVVTGSVPEFVLENVIPGQSGSYHAIAALGECLSANSDAFELAVSEMEIADAYAGEEQVVCSADELVFLSGNTPVAAEGQWRSLGDAVAMTPEQTISEVRDLQPGENYFVWELTHPVCQNSSADTTLIFLEKIEALPDVALVPNDDNPLEINLLENDLTANALALDAMLLTPAAKGQVKIDADGVAVYTPWPNVFGEDEFSYLLCSMTCPDVCDSALVKLTLAGTSTATDCFVPNLITPNGDGENDTFVVPCAAQWPGSSVVIFNRYGSRVFESKSYENDWDGTYDGRPLPNGTYFYRLTLRDGTGQSPAPAGALQGYVVLNR